MKGQAAKSFGQGWVAYLPGVIDDDHMAIQTLHVALTAEQAVITAARDGIADIATKGKAAMDASAPTESSVDGVAVFLTILGAVAAGVTAIPSGGTSVAAFSAGLAGIGAGTASGLIGAVSKTEAEVPLGAGDPKSVLDNIKAAIKKLADGIRAKREEDIRTIVDDVQSAVDDPQQFDMRRPQLLKVRKASMIIDQHEILVTRKDIDSIVDGWMPNIAASISAAGRQLDSSSGPWTRNSAIGLGAVGPYLPFQALETRVTEILHETAGEVSQAAGRLRIAATHIGNSDTDANERLGHQVDKLERMDREEHRREQEETQRPPFLQRPGMTPY